MCTEDQMILENSDIGYRERRYKGIVKDPREFWKYMMNRGMMHFLTDTYDEKIEDIEPEVTKESSLADEFSLIKINMNDLR